jgi:hypothetical protein
VVATVIILLGRAEMSVWQWFGNSPSKYFIMAMGIHAATVYVPLYIGHGVTRRDFTVGGAVFFGTASVAFAGIVMVGYLLEWIVRAATGQFGPVGAIASVGDAAIVFARAVLIHLAFVCTGWLIGAAFYRYGTWIGILLIPVCAIPGFLSDFVLQTNPDGLDLRDILDLGTATGPAGFGISIVLTVVGAVAVRLLLRDVAIRKVTG